MAARRTSQSAPYSGPALIESNLPGYDKAELETERELVSKVLECKNSVKMAQEEIVKLNAEKKDWISNPLILRKSQKILPLR